LLALASAGHGNNTGSDSLYYWFQGEKCHVQPVTERQAIIYSSDTPSEVVDETAFLKTGTYDSKRTFSIIKSSEATHNNQKVKMSKTTEIPVFVNGNDTILFTEKCIVRLKPDTPGVNFLEIIRPYSSEKIDTLRRNTYRIHCADCYQALALSNLLYESGIAEWAEPDFVSLTTRAHALDDQYYLYNHYNYNAANNINVHKAWRITKGCRNIRVAVLDCGVDASHEAFKDGSGNSRVEEGVTAFAGPLGDIHGTACAGIIAASHSDKMYGIAPEVTIVPVRIAEHSKNYAPASTIAEGIYWAFSPLGGYADILSCSWGGGNSNQVVAAIKDAQVYGRGGDYERNIRGKGSVVVFASGNQGNNSVNLYGQYAICVGALGADGQLAINRETNRRYSNIGPGLDLVAFGGHMDKDKDNDGFNDGDIYTLRLHDKYTSTFTGTSAACPQVSGVAALMLSVNPNLTAKQVEDILFRTATDMGPKGRDDSYGHGLVNAFEAVKESLLETAFVDFSFEDGILEKTDEDILTFTLKKDRGNLNALTVYKADRYKLSLTLPYITDLAWLIKDGISKYTSYNDGKNWYEVKHENGQTIITTYYFYIRYILGGQRIPQWFPTDPTTGKNFLVRRKVPQSLKLNNTQNTNTKAYASSEILLQPGFEVKQGTEFETVFTNDIDEYKVLNCK
ncbi:MAG: S8 family serine peptidase, partial [Bacteroidales bacterium]|nr:S8 family serine peptidase [Bacteroidales bacterium]